MLNKLYICLSCYLVFIFQCFATLYTKFHYLIIEMTVLVVHILYIISEVLH